MLNHRSKHVFAETPRLRAACLAAPQPRDGIKEREQPFKPGGRSRKDRTGGGETIQDIDFESIICHLEAVTYNKAFPF